MESIKQRIIDFIAEKRMSTEEVADAMGKTGVLKDSKPIASGQFCVGEVEYVYAHDNSNWSIHEQIRYIHKDRILFVDDIKTDDKALFGQLVTGFIIQKKGIKAIITKGYMRDKQGMLEDKAMVWCRDITPIGCYNVKIEPSDEVLALSKKNREFYEGSIAVCDNSGVVIIPKECINEEFLGKLEHLHEQEKIWFECVMDKNWDTYDTVCLKKYLNN